MACQSSFCIFHISHVKAGEVGVVIHWRESTRFLSWHMTRIAELILIRMLLITWKLCRISSDVRSQFTCQIFLLMFQIVCIGYNTEQQYILNSTDNITLEKYKQKMAQKMLSVFRCAFLAYNRYTPHLRLPFWHEYSFVGIINWTYPYVPILPPY